MPTLFENPEFRALVVDDEPLVVRMVSFALRQEGFACDTATDGEEALALLDRGPYDLLVTDLKMPNKHGHALAVHVLANEVRPKIMVHTSIDEPRVTKDLMVRGVDDVVYKPANYAAFAAKARGLVVRGRDIQPRQVAVEQNAEENGLPISATKNGDKSECQVPIGLSNLMAQLSDASKVQAVSRAALDVSQMVSATSFDAEQVAAAIQRDPSVAAKVLELANSPLYNPGGERFADIKLAVTRIGQTRVGELSLATSALASIATEELPWLDIELARRQSVAAGLAVELLVTAGRHANNSEGLLFSALMHSAGRMVLGAHYPQQYGAMVSACTENNDALVKHEERIFPKNHADIMVDLLAAWNLPDGVFQPLKYTANEFPTLSGLPEPLRSKVELVKLAVLIGRIAAGSWESWDFVEFPPAEVLDRLGITSAGTIINEIEKQIQGITDLSMQSQSKTTGDSQPPRSRSRHLAYCDCSKQRFDFFAKLVPSMNITLYDAKFDGDECPDGMLFNYIGGVPNPSTERLLTNSSNAIVLCDHNISDCPGDLRKNITMPCSYATLRSACWEAAREV